MTHRDLEAQITRAEPVSAEATAERGASGATPRAEADATLREDPPTDREVAPQVLRGRYELRHELGRGGLGVVYDAWDRELERRVAIKLMRASASTRAGRDRAADRMLIEAQALAQLSAPNVVAVFDVGEYRGDGSSGVFVVMELLEGPSLSQWLEQPRSAEEILAVFRRAGEGLAAAHERGLVHRDFKPANVVLDARGEPKVVDFGLAMTTATASEVSRTDASDPSWESSGHGLALPRATQTGFVMGTPRYMAPEQHMGEEIGPAADQYAFCNSLWEALRGRPLFPQPTLEELATAKRAAPVRPPQAPTDQTPAGLVSVLRRGLEPDPAARWPSMRALLRALDPAPARRRRRGGLLVGSLGAAAVLAVWGLGRRQACEAPEEIFTASARAALEARLQDSGASEPLSSAVTSRASEQSTALRDGLVAACEAHQRGELDDAALDRRMVCLRGESQRFADVLGIVTETTTLAPDRVLDVMVGLPSARECQDDQRLAQQLPPPSDHDAAAEVERVRGEMGRVETLARAGRTEEANELFASMQRRAEALGYTPLVVELMQHQAHRDTEAGRFAEAEPALQQVLVRAQEIGHDRIAAQAAAALVFVMGVGQSRFDEALRMASTAEALVLRAGSPPLVNARLHGAIGSVYTEQHRFDEAIEQFEQALTIVERNPEIAPAEATVFLSNLALAQQMKGDLDGAELRLREALAIREALLTPDHPKVGQVLLNLANTLSKAEKYQEAEALYLRAIAIFDVGDSPSVRLAYPLQGLGVVYKKQARYDEAAPLYERAAAIAEKAYGPTHSLVTQAQQNLANLEKRRGNVERARELAKTAVTGIRTRLGEAHPELASALVDLGDIHLRLDENEAAASVYREAATMLEGAESGHDTLAAAWIGLGQVALEAERWDEAREHFEAARAIPDGGSATPYAELGLGHLERRLDHREAAVAHFEAALAELATRPDAEAGAKEARDALAELGAPEPEPG